ncbi:MAG: phage tail protein [Mycobacteriales bacterium]
MRRGDWLLAQLPVGMVEDDFFFRFASIFQELANTIVDGVDNIPNTVDVKVAPEAMVRWLGSWIGVDSVDAALPGELQRRIVRSASATLGWRGTRAGLAQFLELVSGGPVRVEDGGGVFPEGEAPRAAAWVKMYVASTGWMSEQDFAKLVREEVPAHVVAELWVDGRQILTRSDPQVPAARSGVGTTAEGSVPGG